MLVFRYFSTFKIHKLIWPRNEAIHWFDISHSQYTTKITHLPPPVFTTYQILTCEISNSLAIFTSSNIQKDTSLFKFRQKRTYFVSKKVPLPLVEPGFWHLIHQTNIDTYIFSLEEQNFKSTSRSLDILSGSFCICSPCKYNVGTPIEYLYYRSFCYTHNGNIAIGS